MKEETRHLGHRLGNSTSNSTLSEQSGDEDLFNCNRTSVLSASLFVSRDMYAQDSIDFLRHSGIDFETHQDYGIDIHEFGELIISSGEIFPFSILIFYSPFLF